MSDLRFAHGSGIDDVAWFIIPVVLVLVGLRIAERRARVRSSEEPERGDQGPTGSQSDGLSSRPDE